MLLRSILKGILVCAVLAVCAQAEPLDNDKKISLHIGSYAKHSGGSGDYVEGFENNLFSIEYSITEDAPFFDHFVIGAVNNSLGDRCFMLGVQKTYFEIHERLSFEGYYVYTGEFFFGAFADCGDDGVYQSIKDETGLGFAPFIYHGLQFDMTRHISLDAGLMLPSILFVSLQYNF